MIAWIIPFVTTLLRKPINEPTPIFRAFFQFVLLTTSSARTAPINGPRRIPTTGITKGPISNPIVLPQIPAFDPPNFFTPIQLDTESAKNNKITNIPWIIQKRILSSSNEKNRPYKR